MRQTHWAVPGETTWSREYVVGALEVVVVDGRTLLTGMYCSEQSTQRVDLRDASTGEVLDVYGLGDKEWWNDPREHFTGFTWQGDVFVLHITGRPRGCRLLRVTGDGFEFVEHTVPGHTDGEFVNAVVPAVLGEQLAILTCDFDDPSGGATFRDAFDGDRVLGTWSAPAGWECQRLVRAGGRAYAWLTFRVPEGTPAEEWWRVTAEHGRQLWDVASDTPVGPPLRIHGYDRGLCDLNGRPAALFEIGGRRDHQVWDLARREPLGPGLGNLRLSNPRLGTAHGRPVLAGTTQHSLLLHDIGTGRLLGTTPLPDPPIATAVGPNGTTWAITRTGHLATLTVPPTHIHPSTTRRHTPPPPAEPH